MAAQSSPNFGRIVLRIVAACALVSLVASLRTVDVEIGNAVTAVNPRSGAAARTEAIHYEDSSLELVAVYRAFDGRLETGAPPEHLHLWMLVEETLPASARQQIRQLNVVTDGGARTLAMVHRSTNERDAWILSIDPAESDEVLERTLVHELAHLLTLGEAELTSQRTNCAGRLIQIGCAKRGSMLESYADAFWADRPEPDRYRAGQFVTQYAAENVHEDLAETFMFWVYGERASSPTIAAKYEWFEAHDVFVAARAEMSSRLS
jgi:hypothetical protein